MADPVDYVPPSVSVVVASKVGAPFIDQCLSSLEEQVSAFAGEVIVVTPRCETYASRIEQHFNWVRVIRAPDLTQVPALRRCGVQNARSALVAIIEEHCSAKGDWLGQILKALKEYQCAAVGGPIADYNYDRLCDWAVYFIEYNGSLPPFVHGPTEDLNDANIAYQRRVLIEHLDLLDEGYWPMTLHATLRRKGSWFLGDPGIVVQHRGPIGFRYYLGQRFLFSRAYMGVRARSRSIFWRIAYLVGAPLVPLALYARMARIVWSKQCRVKSFVLATPMILTALLVFVAGEWTGCLLGPGDALSKVE
jgi:hypothetical protein